MLILVLERTLSDEELLQDLAVETVDYIVKENWAFIAGMCNLGLITYEEGWNIVKSTQNDWLDWLDNLNP